MVKRAAKAEEPVGEKAQNAAFLAKEDKASSQIEGKTDEGHKKASDESKAGASSDKVGLAAGNNKQKLEQKGTDSAGSFCFWLVFLVIVALITIVLFLCPPGMWTGNSALNAMPVVLLQHSAKGFYVKVRFLPASESQLNNPMEPVMVVLIKSCSAGHFKQLSL